jgi:Cu2+-exporting ATPase/Cu+-exporting ATPase
MPTDPVCGMYVPQSSKITTEQGGQRYYFCSTTCSVKFQKPEQESRREKKALAIAWVFSIPLIVINYSFFFAYRNYAMLALALPVQFYSGLLFYKGAYQSLKMRSGNMDLLISVGTLTAFFFSLFITLYPSVMQGSPVYFDASVSIISLILTGNYIQSVTEIRANDAANKLLNRIPSRAHLIIGGKVRDVETSTLKKGDIIMIKPGENIPVDGTVISGKTEIDESMLTGEAEPVVKINGALVTSGTLNINGAINVRVVNTGRDTIVNKMYSLIKSAAAGKLRVQRLADLFASYFVPIVIIAAVASALIWYTLLSSTGNALVYDVTVLAFVSVIVIACPCAIGLATPITLLIASNVSSERSILMKNVSGLDRLSKIDIVVFDKTGTLTELVPNVIEIVPINRSYNNKFVLSYASSLEQYSNHPIAKAIIEYAKTGKINLLDVVDAKEKPGIGVSGMINGELVEISRGSDKNTVNLYINRALFGVITLSYGIKRNAAEVVRRFKSAGIKTAIITGDKYEEAKRIGDAIGVTDIHAEVTPEKKADIIKDYQKKGRYVMYVGDGINDAIAIETADFGVAMGSGSDIAKESGDAVLLKNDLMLLYDLYIIGKSAISKVKQNIGWAVGYNIVLIPVAGGALVPVFGLGIYSFLPILAAAAMGMSSVSVVANSLLLKSKVSKNLSRFNS